ncbi:hypothetical protein BT93_H2249 [Corymbia citriodora subsp. variegata]|nr:hypothetical protein BT93_H2249 [Corymbia citriodora subsp. variegata]
MYDARHHDSFTLDSTASDYCYHSYPKTNSWNKDVDCCSWDGVICNGVTGNSLHSNSSLLLLRHLWMLDLSGNDLARSHISLDLSAFPKMTYQNLSHSSFSLQSLKLISCNLTEFPYFLCSLKRLTYLDLSSNRISGEIPKWFREISHDTLDTLDLSHNFLEGGLQQINWKSLSSIDLHNNSFQGPLPIPPPSILDFDASNNGFTGEIPHSICQLSSLRNIPPCFGNITYLQSLDLGRNKLQGPLACFLLKCVNLETLPLGHNEFSDIPTQWLEAPHLEYLDLQSNKFHDLSNNKFGGQIPLPSPITFYYSITSNNITGKIPSLICNATQLEVINLSNNGLTSSMPRCITNFSTDLSVLDLQMNHIEGTIPRSFSSRNSLTTLDMSQNWFRGTLPRSLVKCKNLEVLDLSNNHIEDTFPRWLGALPELKVLVLRSNNFKDLKDIPKGVHLFPKLHILDLSNNNFDGSLPINLIMNLKAMALRGASYDNSVIVTTKGQEIKLVKILTVLTTIDLSHNSFQGDIPKAFGHLRSLIGLNLSYNHLTSSIPPTLGNLTELEWLDLSSNKLGGGIPRVLGDLTFLEYLNLSKNQLIGRIPQDKQLSTFSSESFSGNSGLCGTPLPKACPSDPQPPPPSSSSTLDHEGHENKWKVVWMDYASEIIIGISIAYIAIETRRPKWLAQGVRMLERSAAQWMEKLERKVIKFLGQ